MDADRIGAGKQLLFGDEDCSGCRGLLRSQIFAPCQHVHIESLAIMSHVRAESPKAYDPHCFPARESPTGKPSGKRPERILASRREWIALQPAAGQETARPWLPRFRRCQ